MMASGSGLGNPPLGSARPASLTSIGYSACGGGKEGGERGAMERDETTHAPCSALVFDWWEKIHCLTARSRRSEKRHHVDRRRQGARQPAARGETAVETPSVEGAAAQIRDLWPAAQSLSLDISQPDHGQRRRSSSGEMPARVEVTG
ncbi:hypothetical protein JHW43_007812 [Diplocarpon mali]|nr:hypothetical protein JHW43_007812 [Diplocarpon mali]